MADIYDIIEDKKRWVYFEGNDESETIGVYSRCPECGRFLNKGKLFINGLEQIKLKDWICKVHGEVEPFCIPVD